MVSKAEPRYELSQRQIETIITATLKCCASCDETVTKSGFFQTTRDLMGQEGGNKKPNGILGLVWF